jgi:CHASE3 domain sensor protein
MNKSIRGKLAVAFGTIFLVLIIGSATNFYYLSQVKQVQNRVVDLRMKTVNAGKEIQNGINLSLAALRGYMLLGAAPKKANALKKQRETAWKNIDNSIEVFNQMSLSWTVPENIEVLAKLKQELSAFKLAQQQVEDIAQTTANIPSYDLDLLKVLHCQYYLTGPLIRREHNSNLGIIKVSTLVPALFLWV